MNPFEQGFRNGFLDAGLGVCNAYAWHGVGCDPPDSYGYNYSLGYRAAQYEWQRGIWR